MKDLGYHAAMGCSCNHGPSTEEAILASLNVILVKIINLEELVATAADQITSLNTRVGTLTALVQDIAADFAAFKTAMEAERENLTAAGQAALDDANASLDSLASGLGSLDVAVGDADGSETPPVEPTP